MPELKTMSLQEFVDSGLLQEVNRRFLHIFGLALYVTKTPGDGKVIGIGGIIDQRDDPAGLVFDAFDEDHRKRYENVENEMQRRLAARAAQLGFGIQPIPGTKEATAPGSSGSTGASSQELEIAVD